MKRRARFAAAALPLCGLAVLWAWSAHVYDQGTEWEVPIIGYDPRDYLRGHYVEFTYDWPGIDEGDAIPGGLLCIEGNAPVIAKVAAHDDSVICGNPLRVTGDGVYGWDSLNRGRLYIGQARAAQLQQSLRNREQRGIVTIRQREDGSFTPVSIRFRPLTPQEFAERDAPPNQPFDPLGPPAVMDAP